MFIVENGRLNELLIDMYEEIILDVQFILYSKRNFLQYYISPSWDQVRQIP